MRENVELSLAEITADLTSDRNVTRRQKQLLTAQWTIAAAAECNLARDLTNRLSRTQEARRKHPQQLREALGELHRVTDRFVPSADLAAVTPEGKDLQLE